MLRIPIPTGDVKRESDPVRLYTYMRTAVFVPLRNYSPLCDGLTRVWRVESFQAADSSSHAAGEDRFAR
jgi:hypothetical protein